MKEIISELLSNYINDVLSSTIWDFIKFKIAFIDIFKMYIKKDDTWFLKHFRKEWRLLRNLKDEFYAIYKYNFSNDMKIMCNNDKEKLYKRFYKKIIKYVKLK